jgi:hypothetical protein
MKWILVVVAALVAIVAIVAVIGLLLPRRHVASRTLTVRRSPADVWALISDPALNQELSGSDVRVETVESHPPARLVSRIADPTLPFGGTWTYVITPQPPGSTLTITEDGYVSNPIFRFVSRLIMGHHATMDTYLKNVAKKFNEEAVLSGQ